MDITDVLELHTPPALRKSSRAERVAAAASNAAGAWNLLFVHADGAGDPAGARASAVEPACRAVESKQGARGRCVAVVPVRETEAWALADGEALRAAFGSVLDDSGLGLLARPRDVESVADPKQVLRRALQAARPRSRRRRRIGLKEYLEPIGERVDLECLRQVPAFSCCREDTRAALQRLAIIDPAGAADDPR